ncbi:2-keto-4-pentenoate hydratase [Denitrobaculum tricleocarpae]|uniref:2-keto-4-pentenoate hydratase n=1 Tax=Denitrobaculum tricleocarpae TaxID=2591009 RepID=UPI0015D45142|nr:fumarylacetoacetate hydrolase family protein [Denitrobaculum tricleocarpae]
MNAVLSGDVLSDLAYELWEARRLGHTLEATRSDLPKTILEAYEVQEAIVELSGLPRCGYKVGSTSKEAQRLLSTDEPGMGVLLAPFVQESPARIKISPEQMPAVEGEFAFRLGRDLPWRAEQHSLAEVVDVIDGVAGVIEVVGTRFSGGLEGKGRLLTTADGGVNIALVTGNWHEFSGQNLREHGVTMTVNGQLRGRGTGSRALGDPLNVLLWLVNHQSNRRADLKAGEIVATGTCTGLDPVHAGDVVQADFGIFGSVVVEFEKNT